MRRRPTSLASRRRGVTRREALQIGTAAAAGWLVGCPDSPPAARPFGDCCQPTVDAAVDGGSREAGARADRGIADGAEDSGARDAASDAATREDAGGPPGPPPPVVLLQLSDLHVGVGAFALSALRVALDAIRPAVQPALTLLSGDLVDDGEQDEQWQTYAAELAAAGLTASQVLEVPGNHDAKGDPELGRYLAHSLTGQACGGTFGRRDLLVDGRRLRLLAVNTAAGGSWSRNLTGWLPTAQVDTLLADLAAAPPAEQVLVVGHHPLEGATGLAVLGSDVELRRLIAATDAAAYLFGHTHLPRLSWDGRCLAAQASTLGHPTLINNRPGFHLLCVDDGVRVRHLPLLEDGEVARADWPLVLIARPADADLGGFNPRARPLSRGATDQLARAVVCCPEPPDEVSLLVDDGPARPMVRAGAHYQARFDCPDASACRLRVRVRAMGHTREDAVRVALV